MDDDDEYTSSEEEDELMPPPQLGGAVGMGGPGGTDRPLSSMSGGAQPGFPPFMGGSMAAEIRPFATVKPPAAGTASVMGASVVASPGISAVPNTAIIRGPPNVMPQPFDVRDGGPGTHGAMGQVQSSYGMQNERPGPMDNTWYRRTPVLPFSRRKDTSAYDTGRSPFQLFQAQGFDQDSWRPKREQGPMFTPQAENIYGMPAQAEVARDRYQPSNELRHQKPFEAEWSLRSGGFHPTTRILPTNVPVLRQQLAQNYVAGPSHATSHPSGLFGESRGELGLTQRKGSDLSFYYRVPFPTSVANPAMENRATIIDRPTARQCLSRPYGGVADASATGASASYVKGRYDMNAQVLPSQIRDRPGAAGPAGAASGIGATVSHFMDKARATLAELTEMAGPNNVGPARPPVPSGYAGPQDVARPTMAQLTEMAVAPKMFMAPGPHGPTMQFMDQARPTMAQFTELSVAPKMFTAPGPHGPTMQFMDQARPTMAQFTELAVAPKMFTAPGPHGPTMQFMDQARPTMAQFTEMAVAPKMFMAPGPNGPTMQFMDQARATTGELTEGSILITGLQNPAGGAGYTAPQDQARATTAELTELAGPNSIGAAAGQGAGGAMTYLMDAARATLKQFTRDYTGGAGQSQLQAAMNTDAYAAAHLNDKLEQAMNVQRAPQQGSIGDVGSNCDRVGFGDASTVRVKNDNLLMPQAPLADMRGQGMERWIPQVTVNCNLALEEQWVNDRNSPYVLGQLSQNPYAIPMFAQTGNMNLPLQVSAQNP